MATNRHKRVVSEVIIDLVILFRYPELIWSHNRKNNSVNNLSNCMFQQILILLFAFWYIHIMGWILLEFDSMTNHNVIFYQMVMPRSCHNRNRRRIIKDRQIVMPILPLSLIMSFIALFLSNTRPSLAYLFCSTRYQKPENNPLSYTDSSYLDIQRVCLSHC